MMAARKSPAWTSQEIAILQDVYPAEGVNGAADALPDRSWKAIHQMAHKLQIRCTMQFAVPTPKLQGDQLEEAIRLREQENWSFARIGASMGCSEAAANNAVIIALGARRGFTPASRDRQGRLTAEAIERLRLMLRKGLKGIDIQLRLGISAGRVAEERRRYSADLKARGKAPLPAPGAGTAYSGVKLSTAKKREVEGLLLEGFGAKKVTERTGASNTSVGRIRNRLIRRLARKGECLPGCDLTGKRIGAAIESTHYIPAEAIELLRLKILNRVPVRRAARDLGIGGSSAYRIRDQLAAELAAKGHTLPSPILPGRSKEAVQRARQAEWLPAGMISQFRKLSIDIGHDAAKAQILERIAAEQVEAEALRRAEAARPKTFAEQLERVRNGAALVDVIKLRRPDPSMTLGGVATGAL